MIARKIRTFARLPARRQVLFLQAIILPIMIRTGFSLLPVPAVRARLMAWAQNDVAPTATPMEIIASAVRAQGIIRRATGIGGTCLVRSFVLEALLLRRGVETKLRIGVRKKDGAMEGHAWLEYQGRPINEAEAVVSTYVLFEQAAAFADWRNFR